MVETPAASSPVEVEDPFKGETPTLAEFSKYRTDGELPERFKADNPAVPAPAATPKAEDVEEEAALESAPDDTQELKPKTAKRIQQLLAKTKELERQLAEKKDAKPTEPSTAPAVQSQQGEPTPEDKKADGTPKFNTYEEYTKALARWEVRQELAEQKREQDQREANKALQGKLDEARERYDDADDVIFPTSKAINEAQIPPFVKDIFGQSDVFVDLCYVVGSDPKALADFISLAQTNPRAAIGKVYEYERGIKEELSKTRDDKGTAPEPPKTKAPKPPSPVSGASSRAFDVSDESLSADEWARKRTKQLNDKGA